MIEINTSSNLMFVFEIVYLHSSFVSKLSKFLFIYFIWVLRPIKIILLIMSRVNRKVGRQREIPEKKHLASRKQNLAYLTYEPS